MALSVQVAGLCQIQIAQVGSSTWYPLGYSIDGVSIQERQLYEEVYGDENGGSRGVPIEIQKYGEIHQLDMVLSKWDESVAARIRAGLAGGTQGIVGSIGALIFAGNYGWQVSLGTPNGSFARTYKNVIFQEPKGHNIGTKHSQLRVPATCYPNANGVGGVVYDATTPPPVTTTTPAP